MELVAFNFYTFVLLMKFEAMEDLLIFFLYYGWSTVLLTMTVWSP